MMIYLGLLLLGSHNQELCSGVNDLEFADDSGSIVGHKQLLQVVDDDFVAT